MNESQFDETFGFVVVGYVAAKRAAGAGNSI